MDKYTVDLDKVLNDFEYSELTDHYNATPARSTGGYDYIAHNNNGPPGASYAKHRGDVKHSITNVFNSLDEYINTDISATYEAVTNYSLNALNQTQSISGVNNVNIVKYDDVHKQHDYNSASSESHPENTNLVEIVGDLSENTPKETPQIVEEDEETSTNKIVGEAIEIGGVADEISKNDQSCGEITKEVAMEEPQVITAKNDSDVEIVKSGDSIRGESISNETSVSINKNEETNEESHAPSAVSITNETQLVGFNDGFDCDENELNRYLEELENELSDDKTATNEICCEETKKFVEETIEDEVNNIKIVDESKNKQFDETPTKNTKNTGDDCEETTAKVEVTGDNVENTDDYPKNAQTVDLNKQTVDDVDVYEEAVENTTEKVNSNEQTTEKTVRSIDDVKRPDSLDLTDEKRPINLIGEPGSTPYNNIYVSKQLPLPQIKKNESDTDTSRSASPTFSDISSDCTTSTTPSTETVNEEDFVGKANVAGGDDHHGDAVGEGTTQEQGDVNVGDSAGDGVGGSGDFSGGAQQVEAPDCVNVLDLDVGSSGDNVAQQHNIGPEAWLGKQAPLWIPDSEALSCLHCDMKFTVIKRRHHCRACGLVLCSKCCNMRFRLEYLEAEARVCAKCYDILNHEVNGSNSNLSTGNASSPSGSQPNPNNPMEYCSMVPPLQQVGNVTQNPPPSVMVPVSVLKRKGSNKTRSNKSVMFCDGIRPGSDLTNLDSDFNYSESRSSVTSAAIPKKNEKTVITKTNRNVPTTDSVTKSYIPNNENSLPPTVTIHKTDITYTECSNNANVVEMLKNEMLTFALHRNLLVHVKIINMNCCVNKTSWCFSTEGLINVGQDEIVFLLELVDNERGVPKDVFYHINNIYNDAVKGTTVKELGISLHDTPNFLDSKNHAGFLYIRPTFQCLQNVIKPKEIFLIGILIHRWETPWAKIFPLRLILRLGAEYRYYPSPIISTRHRESVFVEIGHTIINLLADFRNFSYTLPQIRGLTIHMEDKNTTVMIPTNRYDQVMKSISNSSDHILAFAGNFSTKADSHLVCIQDTQGNNENSYTTHAINIHNKPRKMTGASFIVFNGALKSSSGLTAKSSIVEDGLMIQIPADNMVQIRESLRNMKNHTIQCGCINTVSDESVSIIWGEADTNFNVGVMSPIDDQSLSGVPSIRVHNGKDYVCNSGNRLIRWTEVFILQNSEEGSKNQDPVDVSKLAENISKATCQALVKYLDLLCTNNFYKIGIRTTLHVENVSYSAGSNSMKLPPIYMKSLDNELVPVLHRITTSNNLGENAIVLELIFRILNV